MNQKTADKIVRHPTRVQIVALLAHRKMSPTEIADEIGTTLGTVAYHVRTLNKHEAIRLVNEKRVRGAIEHFYTLRTTAKDPIKKALIKMTKEREAAEKALTTF